MKCPPEVRKENPWGCIIFFSLLSVMIPWEKSAQLHCGKRQNWDRNIFLIAPIGLAEETQCPQDLKMTECTDPRMNRRSSTSSSGLIASVSSEYE